MREIYKNETIIMKKASTSQSSSSKLAIIIKNDYMRQFLDTHLLFRATDAWRQEMRNLFTTINCLLINKDLNDIINLSPIFAAEIKDLLEKNNAHSNCCQMFMDAMLNIHRLALENNDDGLCILINAFAEKMPLYSHESLLTNADDFTEDLPLTNHKFHSAELSEKERLQRRPDTFITTASASIGIFGISRSANNIINIIQHLERPIFDDLIQPFNYLFDLYSTEPSSEEAVQVTERPNYSLLYIGFFIEHIESIYNKRSVISHVANVDDLFADILNEFHNFLASIMIKEPANLINTDIFGPHNESIIFQALVNLKNTLNSYNEIEQHATALLG